MPEGVLTFVVDTGEKPVSASSTPGGPVENTGTYEDRRVEIRDARPLAGSLSLEREGFVLSRLEVPVAGLGGDPEEIRRVYDPEARQLVAALSGAERVIIFDHTLRSGDEAVRAAQGLREPVKVVHNDYTAWSAPKRVRDLLPEEADELLQRRFAVIQLWQPIRGPVESAPLAICDAQSLAPGDLVAAERRHPDRVGEIYQIAFNPAQRWFYVPALREEEVLVFKTYDSAEDGRARFTAHGSFDDPATPPGAPPRESIETRTLAFF